MSTRDSGKNTLNEEHYRRIVQTAEEGIVTIDVEAIIDFVNPKMTRMLGYTAEEMIGSPLAAFMDEEAQRQLDQHLERRQRGITEQFDFRFRHKDGSDLWVHTATNPLLDENGTYIGALAMFTDITERREAEKLFAWEKRAIETISKGGSLEEVLSQLMIGAQEQFPGALCAIHLLHDDGVRLSLGAAPSLPSSYSQLVESITVDPPVGSCGSAIRERRQVVVPDMTTDSLWADHLGTALEYGLRACWSTPIMRGQGEVLGSLAIYYPDPRHPQPNEIRVIERTIHMAYIAIESKRAEKKLADSQGSLQDANESLRLINEKLERRAATHTQKLRALATEITYTEERERLRVADAQHGDLLQLLAAVAMRIESLRPQLRPDISTEYLDETRDLVGQALRLGQSVIRGLYPPALHCLGLGPALGALAQQHLTTGLEVEIEMDPDFDISERDHRITLFRVADELLVNVRRHARVKHAVLSVSHAPDGNVRLVVSDQGVGFDPTNLQATESRGESLGLLDLRKRVETFGGLLHIDSKPGHGTKVALTLPFTPQNSSITSQLLPES